MDTKIFRKNLDGIRTVGYTEFMDFMYYLKTVRRGNTVIPSHFHNYFELVFYYSGTGYTCYSENGTRNYKKRERLLWQENPEKSPSRFEFSSDTAVLFTPGTVHNEVHDENASSLLAIGFSLSETEARYCRNVKYADRDRYVGSLMKTIEKEFTEKSFRHIENINACLSLVLTRLLRQNEIAQPRISDIRYAINYIDEYFVTPISVKSIAQMCGYCIDHFCVQFKKHTGFTPKQYIINRRMDYAKQLIATTDLSLKDVAKQCGYEDYPQFNVIYKKHFGSSPSLSPRP